jgi:hypothetical protein
MIFWRWNISELKVHTDAAFGKYLMRNYRPGEGRKRIRWSAEYRDRKGRLFGYDFVIKKHERDAIVKLHRQFDREKSGTKNSDNGADSKAESTHSDFIL